MSRLNLHTDQMYDWHRLRRKLLVRDPLDSRDYSMLAKVVREQRLNPNRDILISKLVCGVSFSNKDYKCYLKILNSQEGKVYPSMRQIDNYLNGYKQLLCCCLDEPLSLEAFAYDIAVFEQKFIEPVKELYRN